MTGNGEHKVRGPKVESSIPLISLGEYFLTLFQQNDDKVAQIQQVNGVEVSVTYADILRDGKIVTGLLREYGIAPGDTVMLFCGNTLDFLPIMLGTLFAGATLSPLNTELDARDILHLINAIKPHMIISTEKAEQNIREALMDHKETVPVISTETVTKRLEERPVVTHFHLSVVEDPVNDVAFVMCSSGTTGTPKGVEMTHQYVMHLTCSVQNLSSVINVLLNMAGPYWVSCLILTLLSCTWGTTIVLMNNFQEELFMEIVEKYKVNFVCLGPNHLVDLAKYGPSNKYDISSLRVCVYGGSAMSRKMVELAQKCLRTPITLTYGMTECYGMFAPAFKVYDKPGNVGTVGPNVTVMMVDVESGKSVGTGIEGEIWVKAPFTFKGYRGNPEATRDMIDEDGYLHTGDIGYYDKDGFFYVVDRIKELFKYKGIHVSPLDIEEVLLQHPQVMHAAVVGLFHEVDQTHARAYVVRSGTSVTEEDLAKIVEEQLPPYKWLHGGVQFVDALPRTATGKINKNKLRKQQEVEC